MNSYSAGHGKVLNLNAMWVSYTCDTITKYCFAWSYDTIHGPDFATPIDQAISDGMTMIHILTHFPFLLTLIGKLPEFLRHRLAPGVKASEEFNQVRLQLCFFCGTSRLTLFKSVSRTRSEILCQTRNPMTLPRRES